MRKLLAALGLLGGVWASNVTATILSYDVTVTSGDWLIGDLKPFGVASQPSFSGTLKVNNAYSDGTALVGFNMVTGSQTWTEKSLASSNAASFSFNSAGNLSNFGIVFGNVMTDSLAINSSGFSLTESKTNTTTGQYLAYGVACSGCVSFTPTRPSQV